MPTGVVPSENAEPIVSRVTVRKVVTSPNSETTTVQADVTTADATPTVLYTFTPRPGTSLRVYGSIDGIRSDNSDDYGVDLIASFRVSAGGVVTARYPSTAAAELPAAAAIPTPSLGISGGDIVALVTGILGQDWRWGGSFTIVERGTAA